MVNNLPSKKPDSLAAEMLDFETPVPTTPVMPVQWSIEKHQVAQLLALSGMTKNKVAKETGIPLATINRWAQHPEFQEYINQTVLQSAEFLKAKRLRILAKALQAREDRAEEMDDYSAITKEDTLKIMKELREELEGSGGKDESNYTRFLESLLQKSNDSSPIIDVTPTP